MEKRAGRCVQASPMDRRWAACWAAHGEYEGQVWRYSRDVVWPGPGDGGPGMRVPSGWARDMGRDVTGREAGPDPSQTFEG